MIDPYQQNKFFRHLDEKAVHFVKDLTKL